MSKNPWSCKASYLSQNATVQLLPVAKEFTHSIKMNSQVFSGHLLHSQWFCIFSVLKMWRGKQKQKQKNPQITFQVCYVFSWILSYAHQQNGREFQNHSTPSFQNTAAEFIKGTLNNMKLRKEVLTYLQIRFLKNNNFFASSRVRILQSQASFLYSHVFLELGTHALFKRSLKYKVQDRMQ